jgi:hypothetical protein
VKEEIETSKVIIPCGIPFFIRIITFWFEILLFDVTHGDKTYEDVWDEITQEELDHYKRKI